MYEKSLQMFHKAVDLKPEDYATISFYLRREYKIGFINEKTVKVFDNPYGVSKQKNANKHIIKIRKANFSIIATFIV